MIKIITENKHLIESNLIQLFTSKNLIFIEKHILPNLKNKYGVELVKTGSEKYLNTCKKKYKLDNGLIIGLRKSNFPLTKYGYDYPEYIVIYIENEGIARFI